MRRAPARIALDGARRGPGRADQNRRPPDRRIWRGKQGRPLPSAGLSTGEDRSPDQAATP